MSFVNFFFFFLERVCTGMGGGLLLSSLLWFSLDVYICRNVMYDTLLRRMLVSFTSKFHDIRISWRSSVPLPLLYYSRQPSFTHSFCSITKRSFKENNVKTEKEPQLQALSGFEEDDRDNIHTRWVAAGSDFKRPILLPACQYDCSAARRARRSVPQFFHL